MRHRGCIVALSIALSLSAPCMAYAEEMAGQDFESQDGSIFVGGGRLGATQTVMGCPDCNGTKRRQKGLHLSLAGITVAIPVETT